MFYHKGMYFLAKKIHVTIMSQFLLTSAKKSDITMLITQSPKHGFSLNMDYFRTKTNFKVLFSDLESKGCSLTNYRLFNGHV